MIDIFRKEAYSAVYVTYNWLGIAGAYVSDFFINNFFGYFSIIISIIFLAFGISLIRKKPLGRTIQFSIYSILIMICLASSFGLLKIFFGKENISPSSAAQPGIFLHQYFIIPSEVSALLFFLSFLLILFSVLLIDGNIIKTLARFKLLAEKDKRKFS